MHKFLLLPLLFVTACAGNTRSIETTTAAAMVDAQSLQSSADFETDPYRIGPADLLSITVFQVPDLTFEEMRVDATGRIQMPLIGSVTATGRTPEELAGDIRRSLADRYLQNPQVTVTVAEAASQKVTVDGAVTKPGVYTMRGRTTLMQTIAMAEGASRTADLESVAVFRNAPMGRTVAVFDLAAIRNGQAEDPVILGDDVVVVDTSRLNAIMRDVIAALPGLAIFTRF